MDSSRDPFFWGGGGGGRSGEGRVTQTTRMSKWQTRRDQMAADVNQQLTWSQFRGPGANEVIASKYY